MTRSKEGNWSNPAAFCTFLRMAWRVAAVPRGDDSRPTIPAPRAFRLVFVAGSLLSGTGFALDGSIDPIHFDSVPSSTTSADFSDGDTPFEAPPVLPRDSVPSRLPARNQAGPRRERNPEAKAPSGRKVGKSVGKRGRSTIPAGCFRMGSPDTVGAANEHPRHEVCLGGFQLDRLPVLQFEFEEVAGWSPWSLCKGSTCTPPSPELPAWYVTWSEADSFCRAKGGRLPTEAEYEYAARAGDSGLFVWGDSLSGACDHANFADLSLQAALPGWTVFPCRDGHALIAPAGGRKPNRWGLFDMAGNVWEWTSDWYAEDWYSRSPRQDPVGPPEGTGKVMRGGSWLNGPTGGRVAYRDGFLPTERYSGAIGFRCAYPLPRPEPPSR